MKCKRCKIDYYSHNKKSIYCSYTCSNRANNPKKPKMLRKFQKTYYHDLEWELYWNMYHNGWVTIADMKNMMREKFISNKSISIHDLFIPNNLKHD